VTADEGDESYYNNSMDDDDPCAEGVAGVDSDDDQLSSPYIDGGT
jgi:hypothetical protein